MTPACESAESGDFHEDEVVDCDVGVESSEVSRTFATTTTGEPAVSALSSDPMTVLGGDCLARAGPSSWVGAASSVSPGSSEPSRRCRLRRDSMRGMCNWS